MTIPSQIRYVYYFEKAFKQGITANTIPEVTVAIKKIKIYTIPKFSYMGGCSPFFLIENVKETEEAYTYDSRKKFPVKSYKNEAYIEYTGIQDVVVTGDVLLDFVNTQFLSKKVFYFLGKNPIDLIEKNVPSLV